MSRKNGRFGAWLVASPLLLVGACAAAPAPCNSVDAQLDAGPSSGDAAGAPVAYRGTRTIEVGGVRVDVVVDKPAKDAVDALVVYQGTVGRDALVLDSATRTLDEFQALLDCDDVMIVSVA